MKKIKIQNRIINLDKLCCIIINSTLIELCHSEQVGDKISYNRGVELTTEEFDTLKSFLEDNLGEHTVI